MAALDCLAAAVLHLEKKAEEEEGGINCDHAGAPPQRTSFEHTLRRVSDSTTESTESSAGTTMAEQPAAGYPLYPPQAAAREDLGQDGAATSTAEVSPEVVAAMVENLAEDEFKGTPPPAPAPTEAITKVLDMDVLCGRGGETNHHSGNVKYRSLVKRYQPLYIISKRRDKPKIAEKIVATVRHLGGRFLKKDAKTNTWRDVGNQKAREKTSQALREGAPDLRPLPSKDWDETTTAQQQPPPPPPPQGNQRVGHQQLASSGPGSSTGSPGFHPSRPTSGYIGHAGYIHGAPFCSGPAGELGNYAYQPSPKKMRMGHAMPPYQHHAHPAAIMGPSSPAYATMPTAGAVPPHNPPSHHLVSPTSNSSFAATVSADSDESEGQQGSTASPPKTIRGPRLKLLKKRLQIDQSS